MTTTTKRKSLFASPSVPMERESVKNEQLVTTPIDVKKISVTLEKPINISSTDATELVLFGSDRQKEMSSKLDVLLAEVTKGNSPILFELFRNLQKGIKDANLPEMEEKIRKSNEGGFLTKLFGNKAEKLKKAGEEIQNLLTTKSKSLVELTKTMENKLQTEVQSLVTAVSRLSHLALEYKKDIIALQEYVDIGEQILANAQQELTAKESIQNLDSLQINEINEFKQKINLFENRLLVIKTVLAEAPVQLRSIQIGQFASFQTLGEVANTAMTDFNRIKSALIQLAVAHQNKALQSIDEERRLLRDQLSTYGTNLLGEVAVKSVEAQGNNRLNDAQKLLDMATNLNNISTTILAKEQENKVKMEEAKQKLLETKKLIDRK